MRTLFSVFRELFMSLPSALDSIRIVLVQTYHPGNIGSAARAMKTMGLTNLWLVNPREFPHPEAERLATNAVDVLAEATVVGSLAEAISDCGLVVGTSARDRSFSLPPLLPESCAEKLVAEANQYPVALVFGRERMGLHNEEIQQCHFQVNIPANPECPVMNIASAIQVLCYEVFKFASANQSPQTESEDYPLHKELEQFYQHLEETLGDVGFLNPNHPGNTMDRLQRLFRKARPEAKELKLLRGLLSGIQKATKHPQDP